MTLNLLKSNTMSSSTANTYLKLRLTAGSTKTASPPPVIIQPPVIDTALAGLSQFIYDNDGAKIPDGWEVFMEYDGKNESFDGACYIQREPELIIAFVIRGTEIKKWRNVVNDIELYFQKIPQLLKLAKDFFDDVLEKLKTNLGLDKEGIPLYFSGHSLGGALAQILYAVYADEEYRTHNNDEFEFQSVGFEMPGTEDIIVKYLKKNWKGSEEDFLKYLDSLSMKTKTYQAHVDAINTCNKPWGDHYVLNQLPISIGAKPKIRFPHDVLFNEYYLTFYTSNQHHIGEIREYLENGGTAQLQPEYPDTIEKGYLAYLDYYANQAYWDLYIQVAWNADPNAQKKYPNEADYVQYAIKELAKAASTWKLSQEKQILAVVQQKLDDTVGSLSIEINPGPSTPDNSMVEHEFFLVSPEQTTDTSRPVSSFRL